MHTFSASLLRTNVATRVLIAGEYGPLLSIAHLAPFGLRPAALPAGAVRGAEGPDGVEWPEAAIWQMLCEVRTVVLATCGAVLACRPVCVWPRADAQHSAC